MWEIKISRRCLRDVKNAPKHIREAFHRIFLSKEFIENPFDERDLRARIEKLSGAENAYKVRIGDYRVGIFLDRETQTLKVVRLLHRRDIYRYFP